MLNLLKNNQNSNSESKTLIESEDKNLNLSSASSSQTSIASDATYSTDKRMPTDDDIIIDDQLNILNSKSIYKNTNLSPKVTEAPEIELINDKLKNQLNNMIELGYEASSQLLLDSPTNSLALSNSIKDDSDDFNNIEKKDTPKVPIRKSLLNNLSNSLNKQKNDNVLKKTPKVVEFKDPIHLSISRNFILN